LYGALQLSEILMLPMASLRVHWRGVDNRFGEGKNGLENELLIGDLPGISDGAVFHITVGDEPLLIV
jgi:hypothetical protein